MTNNTETKSNAYNKMIQFDYKGKGTIGFKIVDNNYFGIDPNIQYLPGSEHKLKSKSKNKFIAVGSRGFHYFLNLIDIEYYIIHLDKPVRYLYVEDLGDNRDRRGRIVATDKIKILREIDSKEYESLLTGYVYNGSMRFFYSAGKLVTRECPGLYETYKDGRFHSYNDIPSVFDKDKQCWHKHGVLHRDSGPAIIYKSGESEYYINGLLTLT